MSVGIIAALPREVKALIKGWQGREVADHVWVWTSGNAVVACAGMGAARVALAVDAAMSATPLTHLVSAGLAGACNPALRVGDVVRAGIVVDGSTRERFDDTQFRNVLVSTGTIAGADAKRELHAKYGADAVDMEASTVAKIARDRGLGFQAIKAISDAADFEMNGMAQFVTHDGQFREAAFALHAALRPWMWPKVIMLGRNSGAALTALTGELRVTLDWYESND